jgi:hypothetical protein
VLEGIGESLLHDAIDLERAVLVRQAETRRGAQLDLRRAGVWTSIPAGPVTFSPFAAIDMDGYLHTFRGRVIGSELRVSLLDPLGIEATVMNARNDLIENTIKDRRNGWYGFFCVSLSF